VPFFLRFYVGGDESIVYSCFASKNLQNSFAKQKISVTLSSENIAVRACKSFDWTPKITTFIAILLIFKELNLNVFQIIISNSR
jgi:hypothetical protein